MKKIAIVTMLTSFLLSQHMCVLAYEYNFESRNLNQNLNDKILKSIQNYNRDNSSESYDYNNAVKDAVYFDDKIPDAFSNNYQNLAKDKYSDLSQIEQLFNGNEVDYTKEALKQVGYDIFTAPITNQLNTTGKFDQNYKFSIGEKINAYLYGDSVDVMAISGSQLLSPVVQTEVDSNGNIFISGIGFVPAENKTIKEVESAINKKAAAKFKSLKIKLNVASGQDFSVFVYGQVNRPGKVIINNNSSIMDALGAAGGVKKTGTLRKINYTSGNKSREVDLYKTIFSGSDDNIILRPNDKIFVGGIGNVVALKNGVSVPGIYEIKTGESLQKLTSYAGGLLPGTQRNEVVLTSLDSQSLERTANNVSWVEANNTELKSGDIIEFRELYNSVENTVIIQGNVKHPSTYAYFEGMRLSDILKSESELLEETFTTQAVIRRVSGKNNTVETIPISLKGFFEGNNDPILQPRDVINVYKNTNTDFVDIYGCISMPKHLTYVDNMRLDDLLTDIQFVDSSVPDGGNTYQNGDVDVSYSEYFDSTVSGSVQNDNRVISAENVAVEITGKDGETKVYYLYDIMINGNTMKKVAILPGDKVFFRPLRSNESIKNVKVSGFVKHPGVFQFVAGKKLVDMIEMADGLTDDADLRGIIYVRKNLQAKQVDIAKKNNERDIQLIEGRLASGFKQTDSAVDAKTKMITKLKEDSLNIGERYSGQISLTVQSNDLSKISDIDNIEVQDGDEIYIPRISEHVNVLGEVYNEQAFIYRPGMKVGGYIKQVGGLTPNADKYRIYKVGVNGRAVKVGKGSKIAQGDTIIIPRKIAGNDWITPVCGTLQSIASVLSTAFIITKWNK